MKNLLAYTPEPFENLEIMDAEYDSLTGEGDMEEGFVPSRGTRGIRRPGTRRAGRVPMLSKRVKPVKPFRPKFPMRPLMPAVPVPFPYVPMGSNALTPANNAAADKSRSSAGQSAGSSAGGEGNFGNAPAQDVASEHIRWVQETLNRALGLRLLVDGIMNRETRSAVRMFQERKGLPVTGLVGPDTEEALRAAAEPELLEGEWDMPESGECSCGGREFGELEAFEQWEDEAAQNSAQKVRWIQESLNKILGLRLKVDGIMGPQTKSAIRSFQQKNGLVVDGIAGPKTEAALQRSTGTAEQPPAPAAPPLGQPVGLKLINRPTEETALRQAFVANAYSLNGLECANPDHRATWLEILGPINGMWDIDRPFRLGKGGISTCGLVAEGIWRRMKVDLQSLYQPYKFDAISRARVYAQKNGAWVAPKGNVRPAAGDYVIIGAGLSTHALTCLGWDGNTLISIDGGQVGSKGLQAIKERRRTWKTNSYSATLADENQSRAVLGWIDITKLKYRNEQIYVPQEFRQSTGQVVPVSGYAPSLTRQRFEEAAARSNWREAFLNLNGLNMFEMLRALNGLARERREALMNQSLNFRGLVNMPRIEYAMTVVLTRQLPKTAPGDLVVTGQVQAARNFLKESNIVQSSTCNPFKTAFERAAQYVGVPVSWVDNPALCQLIKHESSWNPNAKNPTSSAFGLFQFLKSTWKSYLPEVGYGNIEPYWQAVGGFRYIRAAYRTPERA